MGTIEECNWTGFRIYIDLVLNLTTDQTESFCGGFPFPVHDVGLCFKMAVYTLACHGGLSVSP